MSTTTTRTFELSMLLPWQKRKWIAFIIATFFAIMILLALAAVAINVVFYDDTALDPVNTIFQILFFLYFVTSAALQVRNLRSQFLRIRDDGMSWRMLEGVMSDRMFKPPYSACAFAWTELRSVREEASGIRFHLDDARESYLPLSQLTYAQRQDIKRVLRLHLEEHGIPDRYFFPDGHDEAASVRSTAVVE